MILEKKHLDRNECFKLLKHYKTPENVIRHCNMVALTAEIIGEALNEKGHSLNIDLIRSAGMLHDIARVEEKHHEIGAEYIKKLGYDEEANIIKIHMHFTAEGIMPINETSIVCIADRMVMEDKYVGMDIRMDAIIKKFSYVEGVEEKIRAKLVQNKAFVEKVEHIIEKKIDLLMEEKLIDLKEKDKV